MLGRDVRPTLHSAGAQTPSRRRAPGETPPMEIAAIFESLREVGAINAEIVIR